MLTDKLSTELEKQVKRGVLIVLSGPTGSGKDALIAELKKDRTNLVSVITTTTRAKRESESEGNPYHFITRAQFEDKIGNGEFFEWVEFRGELYGTQKQSLEEALGQGKDCIWKIDTKGVKNIQEKVRSHYPYSAFIFITASDIETLHKRVLSDFGNNENRWNHSLVAWEMQQFDDADYLVLNEDGELAKAVTQVGAIIETVRRKVM